MYFNKRRNTNTRLVDNQMTLFYIIDKDSKSVDGKYKLLYP